MELTNQQKLAVQEVDTNILVSAAAGSGKTRVLTERVIDALVKNRTSLDKLLIVTFTVSAAAEMKGRIADALQKKIAETADPATKERLSGELLKLGSAQISTIDSFFQSVVKENFVKAGVPADFRIGTANEVAPIKEKVLQEVLNEFYKKYSDKDAPKGSVFDTLENNKFAKAMDNILPDRNTGDLLHDIGKFEDIFHNYPEGIEILRKSANDLKADVGKKFFETKLGADYAEKIKNWAEDYRKEYEKLCNLYDGDPDYAAHYSFAKTEIAYAEQILNAFDDGLPDVEKLATILSCCIFDTLRTPRGVDNTQLKNLRTNFKEDIKKLVSYFDGQTEAQIQKDQATLAFSAEIFTDFLKTFEERYLEEKIRLGILEFDDVKQAAKNVLLDKDGNATDTAKNIGSRYDEILIDEYQDVDPTQDAIFASLQVDNKVNSQENHRFMVGDIKQSIYGFRGSEPSLFKNYRDKYPDYDGKGPRPTGEGITIFMSENFRCDNPIINFANAVCRPLFEKCTSFTYSHKDDLVFGKQTDPDFGKVHLDIYPFDRGGNYYEEVEVCKTIQKMLSDPNELKDNGERIQPKDICILCRKNKKVKAFFDKLKSFGIPVKAVEGNLENKDLFYAFYTYLKVLENPSEDMTLISFLLSKATNLKEPDIAEVKNNIKDRTLYKVLCDLLESVSGSSKNAPALPNCKPELIEIAQQIKSDIALSLGLSCEKLIGKLLETKLWKDYADSDTLLYFYETARSFAKDKYCSLADFLEEIDLALDDDKISTSIFGQAENAVTVMTIHKSKGLQAPVVFVTCLNDDRKKDDEKFYYSKQYGFVSETYNRENCSNSASLSLTVEKQLKAEADSEEEIRLLYVAMTRAEERLYLSSACTASEINVGNPGLILKAFPSQMMKERNFFKWVMMSVDMNNTDLVTVHDIKDKEVVEAEEKEIIDAVKQGNKPELVSTPEAEFMSDFEWGDTKKEETGVSLPIKVAASKVPSNMLDSLLDESESAEAEEAKRMLNGLTGGASFDSLFDKKPTATEIGTAMHLFMEFADWENIAKNGIDNEIDRLRNGDFITEADKKKFNKEWLNLLPASDLFQRIIGASEIVREKKFTISMPYSELTAYEERKESYKEKNLYIQGSIDLIILEKNGDIVLVDYKTDAVKEGETEQDMKQKFEETHAMQLACYSAAIEKFYGKKPSKAYIYSFPLGKLIEIAL